ncbi:MAG: 6-hydroxycyclohex-1-ene-1-carbonyl-CoA dehydrogenase [Oligoflexia bacterium]|nr:6-hydroxycyclohex-1-ene-1-carbonyl-CoA dehydrogenase [Oligoflexia bacterium]
MVKVGAPLKATTRTLLAPGPGDALVQVMGCGLCHTDLGFLDDGVRTRHSLPLILGHEIAGVVLAAGPDHQHLVDQAVVVPAVIPCGDCQDCRAGHPMICRKQVMPGNDTDGGFATHVVVPARGLCPVPGYNGDPDAPLGAAGISLRHLAVIADAVSTPYQAIRRAGLSAGDVAIVVGLGGVGGYAAQIAHSLGAHVVGLDVDARRLTGARGVDLALDPSQQSGRDLRKQISAWAKEHGYPRTRWTIIECSGSAPGQTTAFDLLVHGATLCVVGFTMAKLDLRLSNLMAFDARALGNWGCAPDLYPDIVEMALSGRIDLASQTEIIPLDRIADAFAQVRSHTASRRFVLVP